MLVPARGSAADRWYSLALVNEPPHLPLDSKKREFAGGQHSFWSRSLQATALEPNMAQSETLI